MLSPLRPLRGRLPEKLPGGRIYSRSFDVRYHVAVMADGTLIIGVTGINPATTERKAKRFRF
jgi:hypothetical protein